ncbi:MAG: ABC transporter substrate-binding protein [Verrucomicrobia bacterium]|nr:ABC transporter substrate-binding protein [Deltaproteobacteria bacterium]
MNESTAVGISKRMTTTVAAAFFYLLTIIFSVPGWAGEQSRPAPTPAEIQRWGELMYREGLLPSGEPMPAMINGDVEVPANAFSCVSCHLRSGIGSVEGQYVSPPTNGLKLYKPYYQYDPDPQDYSIIKKSMWEGREPVVPLYRPAYTDETLAAALREGVNPIGRPLKTVMPLYMLEERDMAILIAYLKTLSAEVSPGVDKKYKYIRFATVIAGDVPADERTEMLATVEAIIELHNKNAKIKNRRQNLGTVIKEADFNYPMFTLSRWELRGPSTTWRAQLDEHYRKEPVFALLGGLSSAGWQPMHEFSEQNRIPCLLPITDLPVVSETDWYTLYFNKGTYQEGDTTARYLALNSDPAADSMVLQVVEDSARARAAASGFLAAWKDIGRKAPETIYLPAGERISGEMLHKLNEQKHPSALMLWTAGGTLAALESLTAHKERTKMVFVSSTLLQQDLWAIPEKARGFTYISYPYRLDEGKDLYTVNSKLWLQKRNIPVSDKRISTRMFSLSNALLEPFLVVRRDFNPKGLGKGQVTMENQFEMMMHVRRNYYRDYLFDVIGMFDDKNSIDYERLSFGPGQRYASKGCYIVQLSPGLKPEMVKKSDWVIF